MDAFLNVNFNWLDIFMRDNDGAGVFTWEIISQGVQDVHLSNGIIVAKNALKFKLFLCNK